MIWTTLHHVDKLGRLDPATGTWSEYPLMFAETDVRRIDLDPSNPKSKTFLGKTDIGTVVAEPGTHTPQPLDAATLAPHNIGCGVWLPGSPLRGAPE
jgi:streptogramin lyase